MFSAQIKLALLFLAFGFAVGNPINGSSTLEQQEKEGAQNLSPIENPDSVSLNELVEVQEDDIPDGSWVLVVEEPQKSNSNGETLDTANNIAFRPLFHYRSKQAIKARRRSSNAARRRYYVSRRPYRQAYYYPRRRYSPYYY